jgi:hypothetical protein
MTDQESFQYLLSHAARSRWISALEWIFFGPRKYAVRKLMEREKDFWLREALEWHAIRIASKGEGDFYTHQRAANGFEFAKRRHFMVSKELGDLLLFGIEANKTP